MFAKFVMELTEYCVPKCEWRSTKITFSIPPDTISRQLLNFPFA